jgi:hypothetical protein
MVAVVRFGQHVGMPFLFREPVFQTSQPGAPQPAIDDKMIVQDRPRIDVRIPQINTQSWDAERICLAG